ncbi:MAG: hypothetical protein AAGA90_20040 [Actinomycetota bacterium]
MRRMRAYRIDTLPERMFGINGWVGVVYDAGPLGGPEELVARTDWTTDRKHAKAEAERLAGIRSSRVGERSLTRPEMRRAFLLAVTAPVRKPLRRQSRRLARARRDFTPGRRTIRTRLTPSGAVWQTTTPHVGRSTRKKIG